MKARLVTILLIYCVFFSLQIHSYEIPGKIDVGPTLVSIDILKSGKTEDTLHMTGVKGDLTLLFYHGFGIKAGFHTAWHHHGQLAMGSIAVGQYIPLTKNFSFFLSVGQAYSYLSSKVSFAEMNLFHLHERFRSSSPFVGLDFGYEFYPRWSLIGSVQYAWSSTHTKIKHLFSEKSHTKGPNYSLGVEYGFDNGWSVHLGGGYNITVSKEKHGLRGKGLKLGVVKYF